MTVRGIHPLVGTTQLVFDASDWGGHDVGDNSQFWHEAEILEVQEIRQMSEATATVKFKRSGLVSRHFLHAMNYNQGCPGYPGVASPEYKSPRRNRPTGPANAVNDQPPLPRP